jgi:creatinine amidohydrolase
MSRAGAQAAKAVSPRKGIRIEDLSWVEAQRVLDTGTVVVIPLGAESKEHGPQLRLKNDFVLAEYFTNRVLSASKVVVYPTLNYGFYPAFAEIEALRRTPIPRGERCPSFFEPPDC